MTTEFLPTATNVVSATAAIVSAVIAFCSFRSARAAQKATESAARRSSLREVAVTADAIVLEVKCIESLAAKVKAASGSLAAFSGALRSAKRQAFASTVDEKVRTVTDLVSEARALTSGATLLSNARTDDIHRKRTRLEQSLNRVRAVREELEHELASLEANCAVYREKAIKGSPTVT